MASDAPPAGPLVELNPREVLVFNLEKSSQAKTVLKVLNTSNVHVAFKVKTTQPSWYFVRPNQQILAPGQSEDITILLLENEVNRIVDQELAGTKAQTEKHRFLVQNKPLSEDEFKRISSLSSAQRGEEYSRIWDASNNKDDKRSIKLKVEFRVVESSNNTNNNNNNNSNNNSINNSNINNNNTNNRLDTSDTPFSAPGASQISSNNNTIIDENRSETNNNNSNNNTTNNNNSNNNTTNNNSNNSSSSSMDAMKSQLLKLSHAAKEASSGDIPDTPAAVKAELEALKKRFDAVVEYTVHLTAERDHVSQQLEDAQRELTKELAKKKSSTMNEKSAASKDKTDKKGTQAGFSLFVVILVAAIFFGLGRYFKR